MGRDSARLYDRGDGRGLEIDREDSYQAVARHNRIEKDPSFSTGDDIGIYDEENSGIVEEIEKVSKDYYDKINEEDE